MSITTSRHRLLHSRLTPLLVLGCILAAVFMMQVRAGDNMENLDQVMRIISLVKTAYVDDVNTVDLVKAYVLKGTINGMLWEVLDPYTYYMEPKAYAEMQLDTSGEFAGIGIVVTMHKGQLTIVSPIQSTPGYRVGLRTGDLIRTIDGEPTEGMPVDQAVDMMRGPEGTKVTLGVERGGELFEVEIIRANVEVPVVPKAEIVQDGIAYVRLSSFNERTSTVLQETLRDLDRKGMTALILDLRSNPGGLLNQAVEVADQFLDHGPIVHIVGREGQRETIYAQLRNTRAPLPMVVLTDKGTASASEIVAGALRDSGLATLVGTTTFGKGLVQTVIPLGDGSALRLTTARYATSAGHFIDKVGIEPDVLIEREPLPEGEERELEPLDAELDLERDPELRTAVELLQQELQAKSLPQAS